MSVSPPGPFRLQVYVSGHNLLAAELRQAGIKYTMIDNAFDSLEDVAKAQELSDSLSIEKLEKVLYRKLTIIDTTKALIFLARMICQC